MLANLAFRVTVTRLLTLGLLLGCSLASAARAEESDAPDPRTRLGEWVQRAREKVQENAHRLPPELAKWLPRASRPSASPSKADPAGTSSSSNSGGVESRWPRIPDLGGGGRITAATLDRVEIGYQAGVLKVCDAGGGVLYAHHRAGSELVAIDSVEYARLDSAQRSEILQALGVSDPDRAARQLVDDYNRLPHTKALAVLGVIAAASEGISPECAVGIRNFLASRLKAESDVKVHRMAVLSLAIAEETDERTAHAVLGLMDRSHNAWETFTCQQYFQYHRDEIRSWPTAFAIRARLSATGNPYGPRIAARF